MSTFTKETTVAVNPFVRRQTPQSRFGHFEGTEQELVALVRDHLHLARPGDTPGSWLVPVPPAKFRSTVRKALPGDAIRGVFAARREGEEPFITAVVTGEKAQALACDIVVFEHATLGRDAATDAALEIVSINPKAECIEGDEPMQPVTMWRNMASATGGSAAVYPVEKLLQSIAYWKDKVMIEPPQEARDGEVGSA